MRDFTKCFRRDKDGWVCTEAATWEGPPRFTVAPGTRVQPGARYKNVDLAKLLEQFERYQHRTGSDSAE